MWRYERWVAQFDTNLFGAINVTRALMPYFRSKKAGVVVFFGSLAGWRGDGVAGAYVGSKFALEGNLSLVSTFCEKIYIMMIAD